MDELERRWASAAAVLRRAEQTGVAVAPVTMQRPELSVADAYRIQAAGIAQRLGDGARVVGHKVGVTSQAMQQQMGVPGPDSGILLDDMLLSCGSALPREGFLAPRVEAEIAFRLGDDLKGPGLSIDEVRAAVAGVCLALEVIDTRFARWQITLADSISDNASCARVVVGETVPLDAVPDLADEGVVIHVDGHPIAAGQGRAVLGHPLRALVWLTARLADLGTSPGLSAGDLVLPGAVHASLPLNAGMTVQAQAQHLPPVCLRVG
ncbi:2-keto-4-pentenoate hydratase [Streptomyces sp. NPDC005141]